MSTCFVCTDAFTSLSRKEIECSSCAYKACSKCIEHYLVENTNDPHCMNCRIEWNDDYLLENSTKAAYNRIKKSRTEILFDKEMAMIPQSQEYYKQHKEIENTKIQLNKMKIEYKKYEEEVNRLYKEKEKTEDMKKELKSARDQKNRLSVKLHRYRTLIRDWTYDYTFRDLDSQNINNNNNNNNANASSSLSNSATRKIVCRCIDQSCRGFVMMSNWKCGVCEKKVCEKCLEEEVSNEAHICDESAIESTRLIMNSTKPCPNCGTRIHRVSGCPQMWCTNCNTAFNYNSGLADTGPVHNPHYFEYLRNNNNAFSQEIPQMDIHNCAFINQSTFLHRLHAFRRNGYITLDEYSKYIKISRDTEHMKFCRNSLRYKYSFITNEYNYNDPFKNNLDLRIKWMEGTIDKKTMCDTLVKRDKRRKHTKRMIDLFDVTVYSMVQLQGEIYFSQNNDNNSHDGESFIRQFNEIHEYHNQCKYHLTKMYGLI